MKRQLQWMGVVILAVMAGIQFIRPDRTNPPVDPSLTVQVHLELPSAVDTLLRRSCYDCHSNETRWPWYSNIAPVSWMVTRDVHEGRRILNFSEWGNYKMGKMLSMLERVCDESTFGNMPLPSYLLLHPGAGLSAEEIQLLCEWSEAEMDRLSGH